MLFRTGHHYDGHNLTYLCRQAAQVEDFFMEWLDESAALNNLYIETRYPTDLPLLLDERAVRSYQVMAEDMFAAIRQELYEGGRPHRIKKDWQNWNRGMLPDGWQTYRGLLIYSAFFDINDNACDD